MGDTLSMIFNVFFNEKKWRNEVTTNDNWYKIVYPEFEAILTKYEGKPQKLRNAAKNAVYGFFEGLMDEKRVRLGGIGKDWDVERKPIDVIVIHHTKGDSGMTWQRLNAMHLLRLYAKSYFSPSTEKEIQGLPIFSNHFRSNDNTRMVFYAYHWLVREDGTAERLLADNEIGWHAGNWDINCRSVGICLDGNFEHATPPQRMIEGAKKIIQNHYAHVEYACIIPHKNANPKTTCPGEWFHEVKWK